MPREMNLPLTLLVALPWVTLAGCPDAGRLIPELNAVRVEIINDTGFLVDPSIRFDDDAGFWARLAPSERLSTGLIAPGDLVSYRFDCDELGLLFSDEAEQILPLFGVYFADASRILERDEEYDCGDVIRFRFVGEAEDFGVIVSINGRIVD